MLLLHVSCLRCSCFHVFAQVAAVLEIGPSEGQDNLIGCFNELYHQHSYLWALG